MAWKQQQCHRPLPDGSVITRDRNPDACELHRGTNYAEDAAIMSQFPKPAKRWVNKKYLESIRNQRCCRCYAPPPNDAHHVLGIEKRGMGTKNSDYLAVPLCRECHDAIHNGGDDRDCLKEAARNLVKLLRGVIA